MGKVKDKVKEESGLGLLLVRPNHLKYVNKVQGGEAQTQQEQSTWSSGVTQRTSTAF